MLDGGGNRTECFVFREELFRILQDLYFLIIKKVVKRIIERMVLPQLYWLMMYSIFHKLRMVFVVIITLCSVVIGGIIGSCCDIR